MPMKLLETFRAEICFGLVPGYEDPCKRLEGVIVAQRALAVRTCREYCDEVKIGLTITPTEFVYPGGREDGLVVGIIDYPRFPTSPTDVLAHALVLAHRLLIALRQERLTIVCTDKTYLVERET